MKTRCVGISFGLCAAVLLTLLPGCNIVGPAYLLVHGPEKTPAEFKLPKERPTVIFVDDRSNVMARRALRTQIAKAAQDVLLKEGVLTNVIDTSAAMLVASRESPGEPLELSSLARAVKADIIVYVSMDTFSLSGDGQSYSPAATCHVRVIDATKPERLWPEKPEGFPLAPSMRGGNGIIPRTATEQLKALNDLADRTGVEVARLFYDHETRDRLSQ